MFPHHVIHKNLSWWGKKQSNLSRLKR